ncbi:MAG: hypothetical protein EB060_05185 [Proteobacteria bacterium]|nr:hypothetical protein [Pseudomonadota bacterium]
MSTELNHTQRMEILYKVIEDGGQFKTITPEEVEHILSDISYDRAKKALIKEYPEKFDKDTFSELRNCALDALDLI